ncbi:8-oxo-dGTP diphosphatase MutT [Pseudoteredinibacter isoporae]|uniref:8-oxo-dGTP diphosphatase n=1 Tax=Pseudoteredinibacter isoporae TaxID=570281 RepID=A0A7X0JUW3_9GAMM|nr:8-oxo-dGTP diphosphatase MutT [Pseudoteredinibacter isoporae]MBB6522718.1 8-oxo-dGTP diphosphatase [Pseudoteredinibacter isoporae]NHO88248.1 8-oxo-dGTP diphosphatase MutT [Pseudoteredinibacter isoporae]NIB23421.1 8-oxo-dGTP diphosphatase MutT [Pseudoteredinibacter isoporae]
MKKMVHVMVGVIWGEEQQILLAKRPEHLHQGGLWEFPGGKLEAGEEALSGLSRELQEELDIEVLEASPLMDVKHDYGDKQVFLDIWQVSRFKGEARGVEGQLLRWVPLAELDQYEFPAANATIVERLKSEKAPSLL